MPAERRVVFVVNNAEFFVSHRLALGVAARDAGFDVVLITGRAGSASVERLAEAVLQREGIVHHRVDFETAGMNPVTELRGLAQVVVLLRRYRPSIVHCASPKGIIHGGIAARWTGVPGVVLAVTGLGFAETSAGRTTLKRRTAAVASRGLTALAIGNPRVHCIVQNADDEQMVIERWAVPAPRVSLIPGSGVDLSRFGERARVPKEPLIVLPARMLADKGVREFVAAARGLRARFPSWRFVLAGAADYTNPSSIPRAELDAWVDDGVVEWHGYVDDIATLLNRARIVCLPSYREGMPKALLEAAAAGCAVVTTDTTGCREAIVPDHTGVLVPVGAVTPLLDALADLMRNEARCVAFGDAGRVLAAERYDVREVARRTVGLYAALAGTTTPT